MGSTKDEFSIPLISDVFSLFDEQFSILDFQSAVKKSEKEFDNVLSSVRKALKVAVYKDQEKDDTRFVVDIDASVKRAIQSGDVKLETNKHGEVFAQLKNKDGKYGKKLPIKEELIEQGVSIEAMEMALQMNLIKDQLDTIISVLQSIDGRVTEVLQGQQNDRLGFFYSGLSLYMEAKTISDTFLKKQVIAQALKSLNDANAQMIQELRTSVEYLVEEKYRQSKKITEKIEEHLSKIHQCYGIVYRAAFLKAAIYHENGEISAMLTAIEEYGRFVEKLIVPYAGKLTELDKHNQFIEQGTWGSICHTLSSCKELKKQISQKHVYYLNPGEARDGSR